jgi:hypothetical protein
VTKERPTRKGLGPTEKLRSLCLCLPEVTERLSHGEATFFIGGKKAFAMMADHHHDDRVAVWLAAGDGVQQSLVSRDPRRYFRPPYVGTRGWVGAYLDGAGGAEPDWGEIEELVADAWTAVAPPKVKKLLED